MEYDNDRLRKRPPKVEFFFWVVLVLLNPLTNSITVFPAAPAMWPIVLLVNLLLFPAYLVYSRIMGPVVSGGAAIYSVPLSRQKSFAVLLSLLYFLVIQAFLLAVYSLILKFPLSPAEK